MALGARDLGRIDRARAETAARVRAEWKPRLDAAEYWEVSA